MTSESHRISRPIKLSAPEYLCVEEMSCWKKEKKWTFRNGCLGMLNHKAEEARQTDDWVKKQAEWEPPDSSHLWITDDPFGLTASFKEGHRLMFLGRKKAWLKTQKTEAENLMALRSRQLFADPGKVHKDLPLSHAHGTPGLLLACGDLLSHNYWNPKDHQYDWSSSKCF